MLRSTSFLIFAILSVVIGLYPLLYFTSGANFCLLGLKDPAVISLMHWRVSFYLHITMSGLALLTGWVQFLKSLRIRRPAVHRIIGKYYVFTAVTGAAAGISLSFYASAGFLPASGFFVLGVVWLYTTLAGFNSIRRRDTVRHEQLMRLSYACCFAAVMLRIWLPVLLIWLPFTIAYSIVAWLCWVPNILVILFFNRYRRA